MTTTEIVTMLANAAWRIGSPASELILHRWACTDGRYSWGMAGPCPHCTTGHTVDVGDVTTEADPDVMQRRLMADAWNECPL